MDRKHNYIKVEKGTKVAYLIGYDVDNDDRSKYPALYDFLEKELKATRIQKSLWTFQSVKSTKDILEATKKHVKQKDKILVTQIFNLVSNY
jgi:hypothetical protein